LSAEGPPLSSTGATDFGVSLVLFSGLPSPDRIFPTQFSKFVFICMILGRHTLLLLNASCAMFVARYIWVCSFVLLHQLIWWSTLMLIGPVVRIHADLPRVMQCSLVTIWCHSLPSVRIPSLVLVQRPNIELLPMLLLKPPGYANFCLSCTLLCARQPWCIVITSALSTCLPILFSISGPNILRLTFTSSGSVLHLVMFEFYMCQRLLSSLTSSPRGCLLRSSRNLGPV